MYEKICRTVKRRLMLNVNLTDLDRRYVYLKCVQFKSAASFIPVLNSVTDNCVNLFINML